MADKLQSDAVMWGILKAVGVLALLGLVIALLANLGKMDFSSGLGSDRGVPVAVLVTNTTPDSLKLIWSTKGGASADTYAVPPHELNFCAPFTARASVGQPYGAAVEIQRPGHGSFQSLLLELSGTGYWVDTVRVDRPNTFRAVKDYNWVAAHPCR